MIVLAGEIKLLTTHFFPIIADKISLVTQKVCMCCVASPEIDLDNLDQEKME